MFTYEWFPAYMFPFLNSVSIPCLASMHVTGSKAAVLTNLFGGSLTNEGLGLFSLSFDWQYVRYRSCIEATRLTEPTSCRSLPPRPPFLSSYKLTRLRGFLSATQRFLVSLCLSIRIISLLRSNKVAKTCFFLGTSFIELVKISARN
jgi:hypothetical protein